MKVIWHKNFHNFFTWYNIKLNETELNEDSVLPPGKKYSQTHMPCNKAQRAVSLWRPVHKSRLNTWRGGDCACSTSSSEKRPSH